MNLEHYKMTGRDLIIYILKNGLEDEPVFKDGKFVGFITLEEKARRMNVGTATVKTMTAIGKLDGIILDPTVLYPDTEVKTEI